MDAGEAHRQVGRRAAGVLAVAGTLACLLPAAVAGQDPAPRDVQVQFQAFSPSALDVLPGETVRWANGSGRTHTVLADDGTFFSGDIPNGTAFERAFTHVGAVAYHCTIHAGMTGTVDVSRVILGPLPVAAIPGGTRVTFTGRTADPGLPVEVQRLDAAGPHRIATATPSPAGTWEVTVPVAEAGDYRAASPAGASDPRRLLVTDRRVAVRVTRRGVLVRVVPALPYGRVMLQRDLRDHFGWWPVARARLDYVSEAVLPLGRHRPMRLRVVLVAADRWTPLATSRIVVLRRPGSRTGTRSRRSPPG